MRWKIEHSLNYTYSQPVVLDTQVIHLRPRNTVRQRVVSFKLDIHPRPSFRTNHVDAENNAVTTAWFQGEHGGLELAASSRVETYDINPYDFILTDPAMTQVPFSYPEPERSLLALYIPCEEKVSAVLSDFLKPILITAKYETVPFLMNLTNQVYGGFKRRERKHGDPWEPAHTIEKGRGACRDLAWLFVNACRCLGLAARFVSGYYAPFNSRKKPELHAWAEVFLPGAGWIGFDPSLGLAVSERHIALAASYDPNLTLPTGGAFWGRDVSSRLDASIEIRPVK